MACQPADQSKAAEDETHVSSENTFFQYNIWAAFVNRVFDGSMTVKELKVKGDIGLGSFDMLDGEMVMLDGVTYRIREDGSISEGADNDEIVYADAAFFKPGIDVKMNGAVNYDSLRAMLNRKLPTLNHFYAIKITGVFDSLTLGGVPKQSPPFNTGLDVLIPQRPVFRGAAIKGTMVGFYCPQFIGDINTAAYHFHFISDDKKMGGHVMELKTRQSLDGGIQKLTQYEFRIPESAAFDTVRFDKQFQYNKK